MDRDLLGQPYENSRRPSVGDVVQEVLVYGNVEPLCRLIEQGDAALWNDKQARDLIAQIIRNGGSLGRGRGKRAETSRIKDRRDAWILARLCYWRGFGLPTYGDGSASGYANACIVVAGELQRISGEYGWVTLGKDSIKNLWKDHRPAAGIRALQEAYGARLRDAAKADPSLRQKIAMEFGLDVERVLGNIRKHEDRHEDSARHRHYRRDVQPNGC